MLGLRYCGFGVKIVQPLADGPKISIAKDGFKNLEMACVKQETKQEPIKKRLVVPHLVAEVRTCM